MADTISPQTFNHLVLLAALEMDAKEADYLHNQLNLQLDAIRELEAIPLDDEIPLTTHGVPYTEQTSQPPRPDQLQPGDNPQEIMAQAPQVENSYIVVPDIPHADLE